MSRPVASVVASIVASAAALRLVVAGLLLTACLAQPVRAEPPAAAEPGPAAFIPPDGPLLVTRTLIRSLVDGKQIIVRRSYRVVFERAETTFTVRGEQIASAIAAPPELAVIAAIERARTDISSFPLQLDLAGQIITPSSLRPDAQRDAGIAAARDIVAGAAFDATTRAAADGFLAEAATKGQIVPWPRDLFSPTAADRGFAQDVAISASTNGRVTVTHRIPVRLASGAPAHFIRVVVTEMAGVRRESREEWSIAPDPQ